MNFFSFRTPTCIGKPESLAQNLGPLQLWSGGSPLVLWHQHWMRGCQCRTQRTTYVSLPGVCLSMRVVAPVSASNCFCCVALDKLTFYFIAQQTQLHLAEPLSTLNFWFCTSGEGCRVLCPQSRAWGPPRPISTWTRAVSVASVYCNLLAR